MAGSPRAATKPQVTGASDAYLSVDRRPSLSDDDTDRRSVQQISGSLYVNIAEYTARTTGLSAQDDVLVCPVGEGFLVIPYNG